MKPELISDTPRRRLEILCDHPSVNATVSRFAAGERGADLHVHREHTDFFYVLEGELTVMLGVEGERVRVRPGTLARVPPLVIHGFMNASDAPMRYLNLHAPGMGFADYLRTRREYDQFPPPADGGRPVSEAVVGGRELLSGGAARLFASEAITITERPGGAPEEHPGLTSLFVLDDDTWLSFEGGEAPPGRFLEIHTPVAAL